MTSISSLTNAILSRLIHCSGGYIKKIEYIINFALLRKSRNSLDDEEKFHVDLILDNVGGKELSIFPKWKSEGRQWALPGSRDWE